MSLSMNLFSYLSFAAASLMVGLTLSSCSPTVANRGNDVSEDALKQIQVGTSTREDVAKVLGTPTQTGTFDDKIWYYIGRRTEQTAFFDPDLVEQKVVAIKFTPEGKVEKINQGNAKYAQEIDMNGDKTPTFGKETSIAQQLLGNLGKPSIPAGKEGR